MTFYLQTEVTRMRRLVFKNIIPSFKLPFKGKFHIVKLFCSRMPESRKAVRRQLITLRYPFPGGGGTIVKLMIP